MSRYIELGRKWAKGHHNRMIKVPATPGGLGALEELCASGVTLNVTLIFTMRQYKAARDAVWRGAQRRKSLDTFKSVYSIFVSRVDVYTEKHVPELSAAAKGKLASWGETNLAREPGLLVEQGDAAASGNDLRQHGHEEAGRPAVEVCAALAGSDIQTNPPATNAAVEKSGQTFHAQVDQLPPAEVLAEIDAKVEQENWKTF